MNINDFQDLLFELSQRLADDENYESYWYDKFVDAQKFLKDRSNKTVPLLRDYNSFTGSLAIVGSMTPEAWKLLDRLHERTNKQINQLSERPKERISK